MKTSVGPAPGVAAPEIDLRAQAPGGSHEPPPGVRWHGSLRLRLVAGALLAALVPLALVLLLGLREIHRAVTRSAFLSLRAMAAQVALQLDGFVASNLDVIGTESRLQILGDALRPHALDHEPALGELVDRALAAFARRDPVFIDSYALLDLSGVVVAEATRPRTGGDAGVLAGDEFFRAALETGLPHASRVEFTLSGRGGLQFSAPVLGPGGEPLGVLRCRYSAVVLQSLVARHTGALGPGSFAVLVDDQGLVLAAGDVGEPVYALTRPLDPARAAALVEEGSLPAALTSGAATATFVPPALLEVAPGPEAFFRTDVGARRFPHAGALVALERQPWTVAALQPEEAFLEPVRLSTRRAATLALAVTLVAAGIAGVMASRLARGLGRLTAAARRVAAGDLSARAGDGSADELGLLATTFDRMTERVRAREEALAAETERLAVTLRSIADGVITTDVRGRVVLVNGAAERLTGWSQAEARGRPLAEVFDARDARTGAVREDRVAAALRGEVPAASTAEGALVARDGTRREVAESAAAIHDRDGRELGAVLVFRDVTEARRLEDERMKVEKLRSVGLLAGGIAHDLNNILAAIVGNVSVMKMDGVSPEELREQVTEIEEAGRRAAALSRQLLTFAGGGAPVKQTASLTELIETSTRFVLHGSKVRCSFDLAPDLAAVEVDVAQMDQVLHNLILNAVQAMPGGGSLHVAARNVALTGGAAVPLPAGRYVEFSVRDTGLGIAPEHLSRIFDPYFTTKASGTGLGLATVHSILRRHGGHITAESTPGAGTTFRAWLPAATAAPPGRAGARAEARSGRGRVLVMDDEEMIGRVAGRILRRCGYDIVHARSGEEAVARYGEALAAQRPFDAVVMDLTIPGGMGGRETLARLRELDPSVRAVVSSGYSSDPVMSEYRAHGFCAVVSKPFTADALAEAVRQAIAGA